MWSHILNISYIELRMWHQVSYDPHSHERHLCNCVYGSLKNSSSLSEANHEILNKHFGNLKHFCGNQKLLYGFRWALEHGVSLCFSVRWLGTILSQYGINSRWRPPPISDHLVLPFRWWSPTGEEILKSHWPDESPTTEQKFHSTFF